MADTHARSHRLGDPEHPPRPVPQLRVDAPGRHVQQRQHLEPRDPRDLDHRDGQDDARGRRCGRRWSRLNGFRIGLGVQRRCEHRDRVARDRRPAARTTPDGGPLQSGQDVRRRLRLGQPHLGPRHPRYRVCDVELHPGRGQPEFGLRDGKRHRRARRPRPYQGHHRHAEQRPRHVRSQHARHGRARRPGEPDPRRPRRDRPAQHHQHDARVRRARCGLLPVRTHRPVPQPPAESRRHRSPPPRSSSGPARRSR